MATAARAPTSISVALAVLRLVVGGIVLAHGAQKLFVFGLRGVSEAFGQMGAPMPGILGPVVTMVELLGGLALIVGLRTRLAAAGIALDMLGAIVIVHLPASFFLPDGIEFVLSLLGASLALAIAGPGAWSLDAVLRRLRR